VSGRYLGASAGTGPVFPLVRSLLDLRVDIDRTYANSAVMNRVSADMFRQMPSIWPNPPSRVYQESWIIDSPQVTWRPCEVEIRGTVRWWRGIHPPTSARIVIPWTVVSMGPAVVSLTQSGGTTSTYTCAKQSVFFRDLEMEIDVCASVNAGTIVPGYDTDSHNVRPPGLPRRTLTIEESYREAGVDVTINPARTVIDDSAPGFVSWSPAELHDVMEVNYSRFAGAWPAWRMWGFLAGLFDNPGVGGIMFDAAAGFGGAGRAPERQGFAVFRAHQWFNNLPAGAPANQNEAWALRHFLYTYVHEAGHAFNFLHSWDKNRPDSLSWMNYDWRYDNRNGANSFWSNFQFRFDDEELIHMRHGDRPSVIMGGDPWASGGHLEAPPAGAMSQIDDEAQPIELLVRSKPYFEFMEPVFVELRLRNLTGQPMDVDARLRPEFGTVALFVRRPDGRIVGYTPIMCELALPEEHVLAPTEVGDGTDRFSESVFIGYSGHGFLFDAPGEYLVRAVYQGFGDLALPSNTHLIRVGYPAGAAQEALAGDYFTQEVGLNLYLGGSPSPFLASGLETLEQAATAKDFKGTMLAARAAETVGRSAGRSFYRVEYERDEASLTEYQSPDPTAQLKLTQTALDTYRKAKDPHLNIAYNRLTRERAAALAEIGQTEEAQQELSKAESELKKQGVNDAVLEDIRAAASEIADGK
jgi:hypothetical protein